MGGSSRSRSKRKLEPISIEELAGTTGMSGFCTFLTRDSSVPVPALDRMDAERTSASVSSAPDITAPDLAASKADALDLSASDSSTSVSNQHLTDIKDAAMPSASDSSALETGASEWNAPYLPRRRIRIREASTVQDGHSLAEQAVYDAMYEAGKPYQGESRILTIGLRTLAGISRMAYSNCKGNVRSLVAKLAIGERTGFSYTDGRTYIVYSFGEILRRRKAAGLTHVIRTRGVAFVDPASGTLIFARGALGSGAPETGASETDAPQKAAPEAIVTALRRHIPGAGHDAALELWRRCLEQAPNASAAEVVHFIDLKAGKPGIRMPLAFLLTAVPKCFRQERARGGEKAPTRDRMFAEEVLRSPDADEEQRQWAREVLDLPAG